MKFLKNKAILAASIIAMSATSAHAALPTGVQTMFDGLVADFDALLAMAYPVLLAIFGGLLVIGLVKKVARKVV